MRKAGNKNCLVALIIIAISCAATSAWAVETKPAPLSSSNRRDLGLLGQQNYLELDLQGGAFLGLRVKALVASGNNVNLAIEGMAGGSVFARSAVFPATYGAGIRAEYYLSSGPSHAWMLAPGLDGYYVPANPYRPSDNPQDLGQAIGQGFATAFSDVPTRVALLSPSVDLTWMYQMARHFSFVAGAKLGAAVALNGTSSIGDNFAGKITPDVGLYVGTRF